MTIEQMQEILKSVNCAVIEAPKIIAVINELEKLKESN